MKNTTFVLFAIVFLLGAGTGVQAQRYHLLGPMSRLLRGQSLSMPAPPEQSILDWHFENKKRLPRFPLHQITLEQLSQNRRVYRSALTQLLKLDDYPAMPEPGLKILENAEAAPGIRREKISIETEPGLWVPFYFFSRVKGPPQPLVLVLHGHSAGKIETAGLVPSYQNGNALALAQAGFTVAAPDFRGFGELGSTADFNDRRGHKLAKSIHVQESIFELEEGKSLLGAYLHDLNLLLNYAVTRPEADASKIGVAGTSLGADVALWLTGLEDRIKAAAIYYPSFFETALKPDYGRPPHLCIRPLPGIRKFFQPKEIPLLAANVPLKIQYRPGDIQSPLEMKLRKIYGDGKSAGRLDLIASQKPEFFDNDAAIGWFRRWLS